MFKGEYSHTVDAKGRMIVPSKYREILGEKFVVTKGLDYCLFIYSCDEWDALCEKLMGLPLTNQNARAFVRFFMSGAIDCELDKQGRILLPQNLRAYANIDKDVTVIGAGTRVEIWSSSTWNDYKTDENLSLDNLASNMEFIGI